MRIYTCTEFVTIRFVMPSVKEFPWELLGAFEAEHKINQSIATVCLISLHDIITYDMKSTSIYTFIRIHHQDCVAPAFEEFPSELPGALLQGIKSVCLLTRGQQFACSFFSCCTVFYIVSLLLFKFFLHPTKF